MTIALGVPANDRMDALVEKAGELGAAAIQPLVCERSVVRLSGERAEAKRAHWQAVAAAASEQCGRARVAAVRPVASLASWLESLDVAERAPHRPQPGAVGARPGARARRTRRRARPRGDRQGAGRASVVVLSGPEGGLAPAEESAALARGFVAVGLGPRVLRADTAPLALLAWLGLRSLRAPGTPQ